MPKVSTSKRQKDGESVSSAKTAERGGSAVGKEAAKGKRSIPFGSGERGSGELADSPVKWPILGPEESIFNKKTKMPVVKVSVVGHGFAG